MSAGAARLLGAVKIRRRSTATSCYCCFVMLLVLMLLPSSGAAAAPLSPTAFHHYCPSSPSRFSTPKTHLRCSSSDPTDDKAPSLLLRQTIESLVTLLGPTDDGDNLVKPSPSEFHQQQHYPCIVHIIGTGLTPNLLSLPLSTLHLLSQADVVLYDSLGLARQDICKVVPKHCEVICVGKRGDSEKSWKQNEIDDLILQTAMPSSSSSTSSNSNMRKPKTILRLKGGDPFLFGRARTEIDTLRSNKIPYTYTPAISSCIAGPHLGGIPLTDPLLNCQSFGVWSGTDAFGKSRGLSLSVGNTDSSSASNGDNDDNYGEEENWEGLDVDTLVFLMIGRLDKLEALCNLLVRSSSSGGGGGGGFQKKKWETNTPCAVIQNAGGKRTTVVTKEKDDSQKHNSNSSHQNLQRVWRGTLESIVPMIRKEDETCTSVSPAVFIVGATCELDFLSYSEAR